MFFGQKKRIQKTNGVCTHQKIQKILLERALEMGLVPLWCCTGWKETLRKLVKCCPTKRGTTVFEKACGFLKQGRMRVDQVRKLGITGLDENGRGGVSIVS